jgi:hypothetical protein
MLVEKNMERIKFIQHKGKEILLLDFSRCTVTDALALIDKAAAAIRTRPEQSLLTLTDVTDMRFDDTVNQRMKEFTSHNKPYVRAAAVVGITGLKKILFQAVMTFSKRKINTFDDRETAKAWLITH